MKYSYLRNYEYQEKDGIYQVKIIGTKNWIPVSEDVYKEITHSIWNHEGKMRRKKKKGIQCLSLDFVYNNDSCLLDCLSQDTGCCPESYCEHEDFLRGIWEKLHSSLSNDELEILKFLILGDYTEEEYAEQIGKPRSTVGYQKRRLLKKLKTLFS